MELFYTAQAKIFRIYAMTTSVKKYLSVVLLLIVVILLFTRGLLETFFQQDEWNGFGYVIQLSHSSPWAWFNILGTSHFIPLSQFFWYILYKLFGFKAYWYSVTAIGLHALSSILVFVLAKRLTQNNWTSLLTSVLFATNFRSAQAFTHLAIFPATLTCYLIIILFLLYLTKLKGKYFSIKNTIILLLLFLMSVILREDGLILPVLLPVYLLFYNRAVIHKRNAGAFILFYSVIFIFVIFRVVIQLVSPQAIAISGAGAFEIFIYNAISLPFKLLVQNLFEGIELYNVFFQNKQHIYTASHTYINFSVMYTVFYDFITLIVFNLLIAIFYISTRKIKDVNFWKTIWFCLAWIIIASGLLAVVGRPLNIVESRYLYLTSFPVLLMFSLTVVHLWNKDYKTALLSKGMRLVIVGGLILFIWLSYRDIQLTIKRYNFWATARINILSDLTRLHPAIAEKTIFFVRCKTKCLRNIDDFGVPNEYLLPFTSGPGWIFMLQYAQKDEATFAPFFSKLDGKEFLWDLGAEGYRSIGDRGFGYFTTKELLLETLAKNKLDPSVIVGLEYDESKFTLHEVSSLVQEEIRHDIATRSATLR